MESISADPPLITILAISGSLRAASLNTQLIQSAAAAAVLPLRIDVFDGIGLLPHFNPDNENVENQILQDLVRRMKNADGFLVSTPEYAHGVPGTLKNALDWLVGTDAFINKPFMLLNASSRAIHAQASIREILTTMSGVHVSAADLTVEGRSRNSAGAEQGEESIEQIIKPSLDIFERFLRSYKNPWQG